MNNRFFKFIAIYFLILITNSNAVEDLSGFTDSINTAQEKFQELKRGITEESKIIDQAIKEIDKVTAFVKDSLDENNTEDAIKALEFIEKSLSDVSNIIPAEFSSDMTNIDMSKFNSEDMKVVNEVTAAMKKNKEEKLSTMVNNLVDLSDKGINTFEITNNLSEIGIDTIKLDINLDKRKSMETWTKEQWADSYKGSVLTSSGEEVITDGEIKVKVSDLEQKLQTNTQSILDKRSSLTELQAKIDPLSNQITDLKTQKTDLLAKYNKEILKQSSKILSDEEINESKGLADQFNSQLSDLTNQIKTAEQQSTTLQAQVQSLNLELTNEIATKSQLQENIGNLNKQLSINQSAFSKKEYN